MPFSLFAILQHTLRGAVGHAVAVLDAYDGNDRLCMLDLRHVHFREADVSDFASSFPARTFLEVLTPAQRSRVSAKRKPHEAATGETACTPQLFRAAPLSASSDPTRAYSRPGIIAELARLAPCLLRAKLSCKR
jgi:hypothetical protein